MVVEFIKKFDEVAKRLNYSRKKEEGSSSSSLSSKIAAKVSSVIGNLTPYPELRIKPITISADISPKIFNELKKFNEITGRINTEVRRAYRIVKELPIDDLKASLNQVDPFRIETARYPIESIERDQKDLERLVAGPIQLTLPDDKNGKQTIEAINDFNQKWEETVSLWKKLLQVCSEIRYIQELMAWVDTAIENFKGCMKVTSSNGHSFDSFSFIKEIPAKSYDSDICLQAIDMIERISVLIRSFEEKYFPNSL